MPFAPDIAAPLAMICGGASASIASSVIAGGSSALPAAGGSPRVQPTMSTLVSRIMGSVAQRALVRLFMACIPVVDRAPCADQRNLSQGSGRQQQLLEQRMPF